MKGTAGWYVVRIESFSMNRKVHRYLNSAVLLADAGHSLSGTANAISDLEPFSCLPLDLLGDLVTLFFYTLSRRTPSSSYPYGYGKFESLGTVILLLSLHFMDTPLNIFCSLLSPHSS